MKIRPAEKFDVPAIARIGASAFAQEPIYAHFFPLHTLYPQDFHRFFLDEAANALLSPGKVLMVVELEESDALESDTDFQDMQKERRIVAFATFVRYLQLSRSRIEFRTLAVDPAYQRRGFGEKLVEWYSIRAWEEDVPVFGDASTKGLPLYLRNGCEDIGRIILPKQIVNPRDGLESIELDGMEVVVLRWKA
ncbi:hypothetical protein EG329_008009 [Mollisiaceae sp. DMI_Dod_QoI]|nr:hypothetical protein EG329_008009 [Helotiales sp. DMI_Dod_QoI]